MIEFFKNNFNREHDPKLVKEFTLVRADTDKKEWCALEVELKKKTIQVGASEVESFVLSVCGSAGHVDWQHGRTNETYYRYGSQVLYLDSCGQILEKLDKWFPEYKQYFKWHLNDMNAGCSHQRKFGWKPCSGYHKTNEVCNHQMTVLPRAEVIPFGDGRYCWKDAVGVECPVCKYRYGTQWLFEPLPQEVIDWVKGMGN